MLLVLLGLIIVLLILAVIAVLYVIKAGKALSCVRNGTGGTVNKVAVVIWIVVAALCVYLMFESMIAYTQRPEAVIERTGQQ